MLMKELAAEEPSRTATTAVPGHLEAAEVKKVVALRPRSNSRDVMTPGLEDKLLRKSQSMVARSPRIMDEASGAASGETAGKSPKKIMRRRQTVTRINMSKTSLNFGKNERRRNSHIKENSDETSAFSGGKSDGPEKS